MSWCPGERNVSFFLSQRKSNTLFFLLVSWCCIGAQGRGMCHSFYLKGIQAVGSLSLHELLLCPQALPSGYYAAQWLLWEILKLSLVLLLLKVHAASCSADCCCVHAIQHNRGHTLNPAACFKTYPKLWNSCGGKERGTGENVPFWGERQKTQGKKKYF